MTGGPAGVQGVGSMPSVSTFQGQSVPQHGVGNAVGLDYQGPSLRHLSQQEMDAADKILNSSQDAITKALAGGMGWQDIAKLLQGIASGNTTTGGSGGGGSGGTTYAPLSYTPEQYAQFKKANELASGNIGNLYGTASTDIGNLLQQYSDAAAARQAGAQQTLQAFGVAPSAMSVGGLQPQDVLRAYQSKMAADRATQQADLVNQLAAYASAVKG